MPSKSKICIIGPALKMGGIERESVNLANSLSKQEFNTTYIALFNSAHFFKLDKKINFFEPTGFNKNKLNIWKTIKWLQETIFHINPDTILVYNKFYGAIVSLSLLFTNYKVFISEASSPLYNWGLKQGILNKFAYWLRPPEGVKAQTNISSQYLRKYYHKRTKVQVIPNPLRYVQLSPKVEREKWILAVGRFGDPLKGFDRLIDAFSKIQSIDWVLVFAGGDEDGQYLKERAANLGVLKRIRFLGKVTDIDSVYAKAGLFVMPSRSEGFPNALCEAMGAGLPCISFDFVSGPRDIITDGLDGILVEDGNIDALAMNIDFLIKNPERRLQLGSRALAIRDRLNEKIIGEQVAKFITS